MRRIRDSHELKHPSDFCVFSPLSYSIQYKQKHMCCCKQSKRRVLKQPAEALKIP